MTARVLADYFARVTIIERDVIEDKPVLHKSIPQGHHLHALMLGGQQVVASLYPGILARLRSLGAVRYRAGRENVWFLPDGKAYNATGTVREPRDLGFDGYSQSRGLLEHCLRQCTLALANVHLITNSSVRSLIHTKGRVQGVQYLSQGTWHCLPADFVVDAGGRGSHAAWWLLELGFPVPQGTTIGVDFAYASTKFRIPESYDAPERLMNFFVPSSRFPLAAIMGEIEDRTWHVSLAGRFGNYPPTDEEGFLTFAKSLPNKRLYDLINDAERVSDIMAYRFPTSVQRHYEWLTAFPEGFLVLGDAICSFNPVYGQGMSSAALQVKALQQLLNERAEQSQGLERLALAFFPRAAEVIVTPWTLAATFDFLHPQTCGTRPPNLSANAQYLAAANAVAAEDIKVQRLLAEVIALAQPLAALWEEPLYSRILAHQRPEAYLQSVKFSQESGVA
jgi:2-polyprenyl-6-methoxyphenol hydroxylase-like FAD-dependent oxidoreductase